jgi:hypothetical protein
MIQTVVAIAILAAAWPVIAGGLPEITFHPSAGPFTALLIGITRFWSIETQLIIQIVQQAGVQKPGLDPPVILFESARLSGLDSLPGGYVYPLAGWEQLAAHIAKAQS